MPGCIAYTLQEPFKRSKRATGTPNFGTLGVEETVKWCSSFLIVPKPNGIVCLCQALISLNQALNITIA